MAFRYGCLVDHGDERGVAMRATYIIDRNGVLRHMCMNDFPVGRSVEETLRLVKAFMHTNEFGEMCPASWKPGQQSMKPEMNALMTQ